MSSSRVAAFVSGGPIALRALDALAAAHQVAVIIRHRPTRPLLAAWRGPASRLARALGLRDADPVTEWASRAAVPMVEAERGDEQRCAERIRAYRPDYGCIATWPRKVPQPLLEAAGRETLNLHPSLLPRHRGPNPLFWTYQAGDEDAGVSVHQATPQVDAGPVLLQQRIPVGRGESVVAVHARCAANGGELLARAVAMLADGSSMPRPQEESLATPAPHPVPGRAYASLAITPSRHAWHFLKGMLPRYQDPLMDDSGARARYADVPGYEERDPMHAPGTVVRSGAGWDAWCVDGVVRLSPTPAA